MSRYDGLIIPRSYSEYINKTDAATLLQALQLSGVMDNAPTANSNHPTKSSGVYTALAGKQATLTFDNTPTANSNNPVKSGGIYTELAKCQKNGTILPNNSTTYNITDLCNYLINTYLNYINSDGKIYQLVTQYSYANTPKVIIDNVTYELVACIIKIQTIYYNARQFIIQIDQSTTQKVSIIILYQNDTVISYKVRS